MALTEQEIREGTKQFMRTLSDDVMGRIETYDLQLMAQAADLLEDFRKAKLAKLETLKRELKLSGDTKQGVGYIPINLFVRHNQGHLQIYWQNVHRHRATGRPIYDYIKKGQGDGYSIAIITRHAGPLKEFVRVTEERAVLLRRQWRLNAEIKKVIRDNMLVMNAQLARAEASPIEQAA